MMKFNKKTMAVAIAASLAASGVALAAVVTTPTPPQPTAPSNIYAYELLAQSSNVVGASQFGTRVLPGDSLAGRTTGFHVKMEIVGSAATKGVAFDSSSIAPTAGAQFMDGDLAPPHPDPATAWTTGGSFLVSGQLAQFTYSPSSTASSPRVDPTAGDQLFYWNQGELKLTNTHLLDPGEIVEVAITFTDASGIGEEIIGTATAGVIFVAEWGTEVAIEADKGHINKTIDVATCLGAVSVGGNDNVINSYAPLVDTKRRFAPNGFVSESCLTNIPAAAGIAGLLDSADAAWPTGNGIDDASAGILAGNDPDQRADIFNAGLISVGINYIADGWSGANNSGSPNLGNFQYDPAQLDEAVITVSGTDFSAFVVPGVDNDNVFLSDSTTCIPRLIQEDIVGSSITFRAPVRTPTGDQWYVCFELDRTGYDANPLVAQAITASVAVDYDDTRVRDFPAQTGDLLPFRYNGVVANIQNVWAAGNGAGDVSLIRLTNSSTASCPVTLRGRDDTGAAASGIYSVTLPAGGGTAVNSNQLESVFGAPNGAKRWQVEVVGECDGLTVSALNRSATGQISNLTPQIEGNSGRSKLLRYIP